jgi:threonine 3-dehydrogenase
MNNHHMKALVKPERAKGLTLITKEIPPVGPNDVLIKVRATSICGTDLHIYNWDTWAQGRIKQIPLVQGHELCGDIVEVGKNVKERKVGDFVSCESHIVDYNGDYYKRGLGHVAPETKIIGVDRDGSFAEYIVMPWQNAWLNPIDMPTEIAVLRENFGNAIHTAYAVDVKDKTVLMTGCGPVGLMTMLAVRARGAKTIIVSDVSDYRIKFAERLGADYANNPKSNDLVQQVRHWTHGDGVDVLLEMSGAPTAIQQAFSLVKSAGDAVAFGLPTKPIEFDLANAVIFKGITVHGIVGRKMWDTWIQMDDLFNRKAVDLTPIVTHKYKLEEVDKAFETMASGESGKVVMYPN